MIELSSLLVLESVKLEDTVLLVSSVATELSKTVVSLDART